MKKKLFIILTVLLTTMQVFAQSSKSARSVIHIISCDDTNNPIIGTSCRQSNLFYTHYLVDSINLCTNSTAVAYSFTGNDFNKSEIVGRMDNLKTEPEDAIVFHYSGNGFSIKNDSLPVLFFKNDSTLLLNDLTLCLSDIYTLLRSKPHRLMIFIYNGSRTNTDVVTSDSLLRLNLPSSIDRTQYKSRKKIGASTNSWEALFNHASGNYLLFACRNDENNCIISGADIMDYYLQTVTGELYRNIYKSWDVVFDEIVKRAVRITTASDIPQHPCWSEIQSNSPGM